MNWNVDSWTEEREEIKELREYASKFELLTPEEERLLSNEYYDLKTDIVPLALSINLSMVVPSGYTPSQRLKELKFMHCFILYYLLNRMWGIAEEVIKRNVRLVLKACQSPTYVGRGLPIFDLFMAGYDGLRYGFIVKYNPRLGYKISTYCTRWIHQRIGRAIRKTASAIKVAGHKEDLMSKIRMVVREYVASNSGNKPGPEAISILLKKKYGKDVDPEEISELGRWRWSILSLDDSTTDEELDGLSMGDYLPAPEQYEPEFAYEFQEMKNKVAELMKCLSDDERLVLSYKYGIIDSVERRNKQIARLLGWSEKMVKELISSGEKKMQDKVKGEVYFND